MDRTLPIHGIDAEAPTRWAGSIVSALIVEAGLLGALAWWSSHRAPPPPPAPVEIVLEAPKPAPRTVAPPTPPKPQPRPHKQPPRHHVTPPRPAPVPQPVVPPPPAPVPQSRPAMPVPPAPVPPPPPTPVQAPDLASLKATLESQLRSAIQAAVRYPGAARMMHLTGRALVGFQWRDGHASGLRIITSAGADLLDRAALDAVRDAAYPRPPPSLRGESMTFEIWVHFHLEDQ